MQRTYFRRLSFADLEIERERFDNLAAETPGIDHFCSGSHWQLSAFEAFHSDARPVAFSWGEGYALMMLEHNLHWGRMLLPFEASWCLACPLIGPRSKHLVAGLRTLLVQRFRDWDAVMISGMVPDGSLFRSLVNRFGPDTTLFRGPGVTRMIGDLRQGVDGYLARRRRRFRENLRRAERRCADLVFEVHGSSRDDGQALLNRALVIESRSWKGLSGNGVDQGPMRTFYQRIVARQNPHGALRWIFAKRDDRDIGFVLGGVVDDIYRGYQFSFDDEFRELSLGNVLQMRMIRGLCEEGVHWYDLGTEMDYKRGWSDRTLETASLLIRR